MEDLKDKVQELMVLFASIKESLNPEKNKTELVELEAQSMEPSLWQDQANARRVMQRIGDIRKEAEEIETLEKDLKALVELLDEPELLPEIEKEVSRLRIALKALKLKIYLSGEYDGRSAVVAIRAGQGGTEAMDWSSMLFRMYTRFCERKDWPTEVIEQTKKIISSDLNIFGTI